MNVFRLGIAGTLVVAATVIGDSGPSQAVEVGAPEAVADIWDGTGSSEPGGFEALGDLVLFSADDGVNGRELWVHDTSTHTTTMIEIVPGPVGSNPVDLTPAGDRMFFNADDGTGDRELWKTDGTPAGTKRVADISTTGSSNPGGMVALGDLVVFAAKDSSGDHEPWVSDGTASGTVRLADINSTGGSHIGLAVPFENELYFSAYDGAERPLWRTDGTPGGTQQVTTDGAPDRASDLAVFGDMLLFNGDRRLWKTDGSTTGTILLDTAAVGGEADDPTTITASGDQAFFYAPALIGQEDELWVTDGTDAGTRTVSTEPGVSNDPIGSLGNGSVVFPAHTDDDGEELWVSDGTAAGTMLLADLEVGPDDSDPRGMFAHNGFVFFSAVTGALGEELYVTDGDTVELVQNIGAGATSGVDGNGFEEENDATMLSAGASLYFTATTAGYGTEPWVLETTGAFLPLTPARIMETRSGYSTVDGLHNAVGVLAAGSTYELPVVGRAGVPHGATAVSLNVTAVSPQAHGYVTVFACGTSRPVASNINYGPGDVAPNAVLTPVGTNGKVCLFTLAATDLIVDINGAFEAYSGFDALTPARIMETRSGYSTVDGLHNGVGALAAGSTYELPVLDRAGVPVDTAAVSLNVTAVSPQAHGYVTVFACGSDRPVASNINYAPGDVAPNAVLTPVGPNGKVCLFTLAATDLIVDINGAFQGESGFDPLSPARIMETRSGYSTVDGLHNGVGVLPAGSTYELPVVGRSGVPAGLVAVSLNVTAVSPQGPGYVTVFACGSDRPVASNINYGPGDVAPNAVLTPVGPNGKVCLFTLAATDLIVDINGAFVS